MGRNRSVVFLDECVGIEQESQSHTPKMALGGQGEQGAGVWSSRKEMHSRPTGIVMEGPSALLSSGSCIWGWQRPGHPSW